mmetsp:Transcript_132696/g.322448  ORF Transcript_132696/g.322448 Transcript_132696/m.322448 type:complete len:1090 (-) Transcript_132696:15-3284(-)
MNHHFAASWLQSLSGKLESLTPWSWTSNRQGSCTTHRNLFREFFSAPFQKTLALVDERKKTEFLGVIERNLHKFDESTQQFPLGCLCALLQHGKDSPGTQEKVVAWVDFLLARLGPGGGGREAAALEVAEECLSPAFQKFVPLMEGELHARLADGLGEHLGRLDEAAQRRLLEQLPALPARIEELVAGCAGELNAWLEAAPRYPATPSALAEALGRLERPLVRFFTVVKDAARKEAFLVAVALVLQALRTRFRWMCAVELELEGVGKELQRRFFTVEGQGPVMELWLSSRLKKYNAEVAARTTSLVASDPSKFEALRSRLQPLFPDRSETDPDSDWVPLDGPSVISKTVLAWLSDSCPGFFCPQHTLARETLTGVLQRFGRYFEVDLQRSRARLGLPIAEPPPPKEPPPPPKQPPLQPVPALPAPGQGQGQVLPAGPPVPVLVPPPLTIPGSTLAVVRPMTPATVPPPLQIRPSPPAGPEVDNLIDLLLNEALEGMPGEVRARIAKVGHGVYRFGTKEVTLHTQNGRLYVYRIGEVLRHVPFQTLLQEEGLTPAALAAAGLSATTSSGVADTSSVARIALQAKQISSGVTTTTTAALQPAPFGLSRPVEQKSDPQALMSKRVEAATKAMDVSKQIVRRSVNFEDDRLLRRLLSKGLKHDKQWQAAYQEYCTARGVTEHDQRLQDKDFIATFIEQNLASSINQEWAKKILWSHSQGGDKKEKKEKKDRKDKEKKKKDKKRRASGSSSGSERAVGASSGAAVPPPAAPMDMPMAMSMYGGMPLGVGGMMGQLGQLGQLGAPGGQLPMYCPAPLMMAPPFPGAAQPWGCGPMDPAALGAGGLGGEDLEEWARQQMEGWRSVAEAVRRAKGPGAGPEARAGVPARGSTSSSASGAIAGSGRGSQRRVGTEAFAVAGANEEGSRTTVMLRNLPNDYTRNMLLKLLDDEGFNCKYNFVYLPVDFKRMAGLGYAFVNMDKHEYAQEIWKHFDGFNRWTLSSPKVCQVAWGEPLQGLEAHIERYRNSPVMHPDVDEMFKPVVFKNGQRQTFPAPTKRLRQPRMKYRTPVDGRASTASADPAQAESGDGGTASSKFVD